MNSIVSELRFFFTQTPDRPDLARRLVRLSHPRKLPVVLSRDEVARLLNATTCLKHQAALSVVRVARRDPNPDVASDRDHCRLRTSRTRLNASASTFSSTRTLLPSPSLISIRPRRFLTGVADGGSTESAFSTAGPAGTTRTGTRCGTVKALLASRAYRRHVNTKLVAMPCLRAISATTAPGASVSSTIRIFASRDQRRRRSIPPRTSIRVNRP